MFRNRTITQSKSVGRSIRTMLTAVVAGLALIGPGVVATKFSPAAQAANSGVRYFNSYSAAKSFANSISRGYHTKILKTGKQYRVEYWKKGSHG